MGTISRRMMSRIDCRECTLFNPYTEVLVNQYLAGRVCIIQYSTRELAPLLLMEIIRLTADGTTLVHWKTNV